MAVTEKNGPATAFEAQKGKGRPKGVPNKATIAIKEMVIQALDKAGGVNYLARQAEETPSAFMALVAKVIPTQITGEDGGAIQIEQRVREDAEFVAGAVASLVERARASGVASSTQH